MTQEWSYGDCIQCGKVVMSDESRVQTDQGIMHFDCFRTSQPKPNESGYFPPYDDLGNKRTIKNAVDCGWSAIN